MSNRSKKEKKIKIKKEEEEKSENIPQGDIKPIISENQI